MEILPLEPVAPGGSASHPGVHRWKIRRADVAQVNAVRRILLSEIPSVSMHFDVNTASSDDIRVLENTSSLHNEMLTHRIALVPLHFGRDAVERHIKGSVELTLDVANETAEIQDVTTRDFRVTDGDGNALDSARILPPSHLSGDHVLIARLKPGQRLRVVCHPSVGTAAEFAGRSPVSLVSYEIEDPPSGGGDRSVVFSLEAEGGISPGDMFRQAWQILETGVRAFAEGLPEPASVPCDDPPGEVSWVFDVRDVSAGVMSVVQSWLARQPWVSFAGYHQPHQLERRTFCLVVRFSRPDKRAPDSRVREAVLSELLPKIAAAAVLKKAPKK